MSYADFELCVFFHSDINQTLLKLNPFEVEGCPVAVPAVRERRMEGSTHEAVRPPWLTRFVRSRQNMPTQMRPLFPR